MCSTSVKVLKCLLTSNQLYLAVAVEWKYDWGGLVRKAAKQPIIYVKRQRVRVKN